MKQCNYCTKDLELTAFRRGGKTCRECEAQKARKYYWSHREERLAYGKIHREKNEKYYKDYWNDPINHRRHRSKRLERIYGITLEEKEKRWKEQGEKCLLCEREVKTFQNVVVDHDHITGKIRGIICRICNTVLGVLNDDPKYLKKAARYLTNSKKSDMI